MTNRKLAELLFGKKRVAELRTLCPHGSKITNPVTWASTLCWNAECSVNGKEVGK